MIRRRRRIDFHSAVMFEGAQAQTHNWLSSNSDFRTGKTFIEWRLFLSWLQEGCAERSEVRQLQFMAWPDHGVPEYSTPLLMFIRRFRSLQPPDSGPVVVHCR